MPHYTYQLQFPHTNTSLTKSTCSCTASTQQSLSNYIYCYPFTLHYQSGQHNAIHSKIVSGAAFA